MKRTIEINYGTSITLNKGNYENWKPMWHQKTIFEFNGKDHKEIEVLEAAEFERLKVLIDRRAQADWERNKLEISGLRIRVKDGKRYVSVTSVITPEKPPIDEDYGIRGTEIHKLCNFFIDTGEWPIPQAPLKKLKYEDIPYQAFFEKFKDRIDFKKCEQNIEVFNDTHLYSGEIDLICGVDGLTTLIDYKSGGWDWMQLVAYYKAKMANYKAPEAIKQLAIFDLKNTKLEILALDDPKCRDKWEKFLVKRGIILARFDV